MRFVSKRPRNLLFPALAASLFFFAGCLGGGGTETDDEDTAEHDEETGAIEGYVVSIDQLPIIGAGFLLQPGEITTYSNQNGFFAFSYLAPGEYTLYVTSLGFHDKAIPVSVTGGKAEQLPIELEEIYVPEPRREIHGPFEGYFHCRWAGVGSGPCGYVGVCLVACVETTPVSQTLQETIWTGDQVAMAFNLTGDDWEEIVIEMRWQPSSVATNSQMRALFSYQGRESTHLFGRSDSMDSPLWYNYTKGQPHAGAQGGDPKAPDMNYTLVAWPAVGTAISTENPKPASVAYEMRFETIATVFYSSRAPEGYTGFEE